MARIERGFGRDWMFSTFHRSMPPPAYMIDIDTVECCSYCKEPISISEVARDVGQDYKPATIVHHLARKANIMAFLVFYKREIIKEHLDIVIAKSQLTREVTICPHCGREIKDTNTIPALTANQNHMLWSSLQTESRKVFRMRQLYPLFSQYHFTPQQFYDFVGQAHREHELNCPKLPRKLFVGVGTYR